MVSQIPPMAKAIGFLCEEDCEVKIYYQKRKVDYADYISKRYYFNPSEVLIRSKNGKED
jgi:hypothetical protein